MRYAALLFLVLSGCTSQPAPAPDPREITRVEQQSGTSALLIAVSPVDENVVWASGSLGTWLRTTDGGATWQAGRVPGADSLQFRDVHAIDANTAYLLSIGNGDQSRIYKTTDAGANWTLQFTNPDPRGFYDCFDFWDAQRGIAIGDEFDGRIQMIRTDDGGTTWRKVESGLPAAQSGEGSFAASGLCVETGRDGHAWIVMSNPQRARLLHTQDYGATWAIDTLPITTREGVGPQAVSFRDNSNGVVLGGGYNSQPEDILAAISRDGGKTWTARTRPPQRRGIWGGVFVPGTNPPAIIAVGPDGIAVSYDEAETWMQLDTFNYWSVGFASPRAGWAVGMNGRITKLSGVSVRQ